MLSNSSVRLYSPELLRSKSRIDLQWAWTDAYARNEGYDKTPASTLVSMKIRAMLICILDCIKRKIAQVCYELMVVSRLDNYIVRGRSADAAVCTDHVLRGQWRGVASKNETLHPSISLCMSCDDIFCIRRTSLTYPICLVLQHWMV